MKKVAVVAGIVVVVVAAVAAVAAVVLHRYGRPPAPPPRVDVVVETQGLGTNEASRYLAQPIEMLAPAGATRIETFVSPRSARVSFFLEPGADVLAARQSVAQALATSASLPPGALPSLDAPGDDQLHLVVEAPTRSLAEVRDIADWVIRRELLQVPGIGDVRWCGGEERRVEVRVEEPRAGAYGMTFGDVASAVAKLRADSLDRLRDAEISSLPPRPIHVRDVAEVRFGAAPPECTAVVAPRAPTVVGTIRVRREARGSIGTAAGAAVARIQAALPTGVTVRPLDFAAEPKADVAARERLVVVRVPDAGAANALAALGEVYVETLTSEATGDDPVTLLVAVRDARDVATVTEALAKAGSRFSTDLERAVRVRIAGPAFDVLVDLAEKTRALVADAPGAVGVSTFGTARGPEVDIRPDRATSGRLGVAPADVELTVAAALGGRAVGTFFEGERRYDVVVTATSPPSPAALDTLLVRGAGNRLVRLSEVATIVRNDGPSLLLRVNRVNAVEVRFSTAGRRRGAVVADVGKRLAAGLVLPPGYSTTVE